MHTARVSTVLPSGSPTRSGAPGADEAAGPETPTAPPTRPATGAARADGEDDEPSHGRLDGWPRPVRLPLQVLGRTLAKAWQDRILGLSE